MECVENRYMFDTSALDALCKSSGTDELKIYASKGRGFEYYFTETQLEESEKYQLQRIRWAWCCQSGCRYACYQDAQIGF